MDVLYLCCIAILQYSVLVCWHIQDCRAMSSSKTADNKTGKSDKDEKKATGPAKIDSDAIYKYDAEHVKLVREQLEKGAPYVCI